jgi:hypothetical protein
MCIPLKLHFLGCIEHGGPCTAACYDNHFSPENLRLPCPTPPPNSQHCVNEQTPLTIYIPSACRRHLKESIKPAVTDWTEAWHHHTERDTNSPVYCRRLKKDMLDENVRQSVETYVEWRKGKLFDNYKEIVTKRLKKMKKSPAAIALQDPDEVAEQDRKLDIGCSHDISEARRLFKDKEGVRIHVSIDEQGDAFQEWF